MDEGLQVVGILESSFPLDCRSSRQALQKEHKVKGLGRHMAIIQVDVSISSGDFSSGCDCWRVA